MDQKENRHDINPHFKPVLRSPKDENYYINGLIRKDRYVLSECITLLESKNLKKRKLIDQVFLQLPKPQKDTLRIGITGSPGVGKSTFIEALGIIMCSKGHKVAVLAVDPSSQKNKGSILGDKTRMEKLSVLDSAYIRPSPAGEVLGGLTAYSKQAIELCEAADFDMIILETVGVGQSEVEVKYTTDINILMLQPGAGDDIQGIKRGVVENADIFIINKADGTQLELAKMTKNAYQSAIQLFHHEIPQWKPPILLTSATQNIGISEVYDSILKFSHVLTKTNVLEIKRIKQDLRWFQKQLNHEIVKWVTEMPYVKNIQNTIEKDIEDHQITATQGIQRLMFEIKTMLKGSSH